jgi:hypothetical protein
MLFYYPHNEKFVSALSLTSNYINEKGYFPRFSISIYDDPYFIFPRQEVNGQQILSIIDSDFNFSFGGSSPLNASNYVNGIAGISKTFYLKILVNQTVTDSISQSSNYFVLSATMTYGDSIIKYYPVTCIAKFEFFTLYSATITFINSDFKNYLDGNVFFNLVSDYNFSLNFPISISATNPSFSGISSNVNIFSQGIAPGISEPYFAIQNYSLTYGYSINFSQFLFTPISFNTPVNLFNTSTNIINFYDAGTLIKISFLNGVLISTLNYFGFTFTNSEMNFNPKTSAVYTLILRTNLGNLYRIESCTILNNLTSLYYNVIFEFKNIKFQTEYVDYLLLEVQPLINTGGQYSITFLSFLNAHNSSYTTFSLSKDENYTYDCFKNKIYFKDLNYNDTLHSKEKNGLVVNILSTIDADNFLVTSEKNKIVVPVNTSFLTKNGFKFVNLLSIGDEIETISGLEKITAITRTKEKTEILNFSDHSDYVFNEFYIKNPLYLENFTGSKLPKHILEINEIKLNEQNVKCFYKNNSLNIRDLILEKNKINVFTLNEVFETIYINFSLKESLFINIGEQKLKLSSNENKIFLKNTNNSNTFSLKSNSEIKILNLIII